MNYLTDNTDGVSVTDLEEMEYTWALWDISPFVVKYGLERVLKDIEAHIACRDQQVF